MECQIRHDMTVRFLLGSDCSSILSSILFHAATYPMFPQARYEGIRPLLLLVSFRDGPLLRTEVPSVTLAYGPPVHY